jgi:uncharacterized protein YchJ
MTRKSDGKEDTVHFQVDRFVQQNGEWFYITREGEQRGPFENKDDAEADLAAYIRHKHNMEEYGQ